MEVLKLVIVDDEPILLQGLKIMKEIRKAGTPCLFIVSSAGRAEADSLKPYMEQALSYIAEHLQDENLSVVTVADFLYLNPVYFGRVFKHTFQMTFRHYVLSLRMERAKLLLEEGNDSIGSVCEQVGISNPSYFSQLFKQYTGKAPSEYKKDRSI